MLKSSNSLHSRMPLLLLKEKDKKEIKENVSISAWSFLNKTPVSFFCDMCNHKS